MDPYVLKRLWRRPWLSLCSLVLSALLCFLLGYLTSYRQAQQEKLAETKESFDILCVVTDRRGTKSTSLRMPSLNASYLWDTELGIGSFVKDLRMTKEYEFVSPQLGLMADMMGYPLLGVTNERCSEILDPALGGEVTLTVPDFYQRGDYVCIVSQEIYDSLEEKSAVLRVTDPAVSRREDALVGIGQIEFQVVGYYAGSGSSIFMPYNAAMTLAVEIRGKNYTDSASFLAADNQQLEALSRAASAYFGAVDPMASSSASPAYALTIHDEQYRATVAALEQNIQRTGYLLPIVLLLGLGVGFLISFLSTRNESRTYALMRTLGLTRLRLFFSILREQLLLVVAAVLAVLALTGEAVPILIYLLCYGIGCGLCVIRAVRVPPTAILREQE